MSQEMGVWVHLQSQNMQVEPIEACNEDDFQAKT